MGLIRRTTTLLLRTHPTLGYYPCLYHQVHVSTDSSVPDHAEKWSFDLFSPLKNTWKYFGQPAQDVLPASDMPVAHHHNTIISEKVPTTMGLAEATRAATHPSVTISNGVYGVIKKFPSASSNGLIRLLVELGSLFPDSREIARFNRGDIQPDLSTARCSLKSLPSNLVQVSAKARLHIIKAMAFLRYSPKEASLQSLLEAIHKDLHSLDFNSLTDLMQALAILGCPSSNDILNSIGNHAMDLTQKSLKRNPTEHIYVVQLLEAFASLGYAHEGFLESAGDSLRDRIQVLSEESLALAIQGFTRLQFNHKLFLDCAVQECIIRQPIKFEPAQITGIVQSLAVLRNEDVMSEILMDITSLTAAKRVDDFTAGELADLLWSYTKLFKYHRDVKMLDGLTRSLVSKVASWKGSTEDLLKFIESVTDSDLGSCQEQYNQILSSAEEIVYKDMDRMPDETLVRILIAYSRAKHYSERCFTKGLKLLGRTSGTLATADLVDLFHSCAVLMHLPEAKFIDKVLAVVTKKRGELSARQMTQVIWGLALFGKLDSTVFRQFCEHINDKGSLLQVKDMQRLIQAEMLLSITCKAQDLPCVRVPDPLCSTVRSTWRERLYFSPSVSSFQREVGLMLMKLSIPHEVEQLVEDGDCRVDFQIMAESGRKVAIDCDGPRRFSLNAPHRALGDTVANRRILRGKGWELLSIPKHEWQKLASSEARESHVRAMLRAVL